MNCKLLNMTTKKVLEVNLLEVNVSPTHLLLCGKWFTHKTTLWFY